MKQYSTVDSSTVRYSTVQYCTVLYSTVPYCTGVHSTVLFHYFLHFLPALFTSHCLLHSLFLFYSFVLSSLHSTHFNILFLFLPPSRSNTPFPPSLYFLPTSHSPPYSPSSFPPLSLVLLSFRSTDEQLQEMTSPANYNRYKEISRPNVNKIVKLGMAFRGTYALTSVLTYVLTHANDNTTIYLCILIAIIVIVAIKYYQNVF